MNIPLEKSLMYSIKVISMLHAKLKPHELIVNIFVMGSFN